MFSVFLNEMNFPAIFVGDSGDAQIGEQAKLEHSFASHQRFKSDGSQTV